MIDLFLISKFLFFPVTEFECDFLSMDAILKPKVRYGEYLYFPDQ